MVRLAACNPNGAVANGQTVFNRLQNGAYIALPDSGKCIAENCAMWRWIPHTERGPVIKEHPGGYRSIIDGDVTGIPTRGYCGLAGSPST